MSGKILLKTGVFPLLILILVLNIGTRAQTEPVSGPALDTLMAAQNLELQHYLEGIYDESAGFLVTGPFDPRLEILKVARPLYNSVRVLAPDWDSYNYAIRDSKKMSIPVGHAGYGGHLYEVDLGDRLDTALLISNNQDRYLIWLRRVTELGWNTVASPKLMRYAASMRNYFSNVDNQRLDDSMPPTSKYKLPVTVGLYPPLPEDVFPNVSAYIEYINRYKAINLPIDSGDTEITVTPETAAWFRENAPAEAYPNKSAIRLQDEYRDFIHSEGDFSTLKVLSKELFDNMVDGEYIFAVSLTGKIRYAVKLSDEDIARIEKATGHKPAVATQAMLFPGEPVMAAGSFTVKTSSEPKLAHIDAYSEPFFYSKIDPSVKEDIAERSDHFLTTLGHLFKSLDSLGIDYLGAKVSKFGSL